MTETFRLTMAQLNPTLGDMDGNTTRALAAWEEGKAAGADMVLLPEMFLVGYQPQDIVRKEIFTREAMARVEALAERVKHGPILGIGHPWLGAHGPDALDVTKTDLYNAYSILKGGKIVSRTLKHNLPNYNVFDEERLYRHGPLGGPFNAGPLRIGVPICEDAWFPDVAEAMVESGADILAVPNGSPYFRDKLSFRMNEMVKRVIENEVPLAYLNMVGGQDDQVFDGGSFVLNRGGALAVQMPVFDEVLTHVDFIKGNDGWAAVQGERHVAPDAWEQDYRAMVVSLRDYLRKTGFKKVLLGLSGGIDSAIVATIATDAIGAANVRCVMMPSEFTSQASLNDAADVANRLGCPYDTVSIAGPRAAVTEALAPLFEGYAADLTEENIQSRLRGVLLMAQSNKFGEMLLTTGNKSEVAVGYATIYGDMSGGYNPIKDMYKMRVFETCRWRNANHRDWMMGPSGEVVPPSIIDKPPTAELRADQRDDQSLPPYEILDGILERLVERDLSVADCVADGYDRETVKKIERLVYLSEYKRFQSAPGTRLTRSAFWLDRRYPIVNGWRDRS